MKREEFENLDPKEQTRVFHEIPLNERVELLNYSHNPVELVQSLSQEEMYLLTREMDRDERVEVVRYANLPQLFFISDVDCWKKDRIHTEGFVNWLETLKLADERKLLRWLVDMDYELVVSAFMQFIQIIKKEYEYPSDELLGDKPFFTLDDVYFVLVDEENLETVRRAIEVLFENHKGRYYALMEGMLSELDYELEEEAHRKREVRLAERGFPSPEIARQVYRPMSDAQFLEFPKKDITLLKNENAIDAPQYPVKKPDSDLFLDHVFVLFSDQDPKILEGIQEEMAWLSNKVIAAEGIDFANERRVVWGIERVRRIMSLGLEILSKNNRDEAKIILSEHWAETIFKRALYDLKKLRDGAFGIVKKYWLGNTEAFYSFLDVPYEGLFRGLLQPVPRYCESNPKDQTFDYIDFKSREEISNIHTLIQQVELVHERLSNLAGDIFKKIIKQQEDEKEITLISLLGTAFALFCIKKKTKRLSLTSAEVQAFLKTAFKRQGEKRCLDEALKKAFMEQISPRHSDALSLLYAELWHRLDSELASLDPKAKPDPRFVASVIIQP